MLIDAIIPSNRKEDYLKKFYQELGSYSFMYRKKNEARNDGCRRWIDEVQIQNKLDLRTPIKYAQLIKAEMDGFFQKDHARCFYKGFIEVLQNNL